MPSNYTPEQVLVTNYFAKYPVLKEMTAIAFSGSSAEEVNIYLDITKMVSHLYNPYVSIQHPLSIASTILNLCAHLRSYYRTFYRVDSTFFLIYSDMSNMYNCNLIPDYNKSYLDKIAANPVTTNAIKIAMGALKELCPYLPGIYYREDIHEPMVVIYDTIKQEEVIGNCNPNIVITKEPLAFQLPAMLPNTAIFIDDKQSESFMVVTHENAIPSYLYATGRRQALSQQDTVSKLTLISPEKLGVLITLTNLPSRGVRSIFDINKAINTLYGLNSNGQIPDGYVNDINYLYSRIFNGLSKISLEMFVLRFRAIDLIANHLYFMTTPFANHVEYKQDLNDPEAVQAINNDYFKDTPIDLNRL